MQSFHVSLSSLILVCLMALVGCKEQPPQITPEATTPSMDAGVKEAAEAGAAIADTAEHKTEDMAKEDGEGADSGESEPLQLQLDHKLFPATKSGLMPRMNDRADSPLKHLIGNGQKPGLLPTKE